MKASDITLDMVREAIERTAADGSHYPRTLTTEQVLLVVRGWNGECQHWRPVLSPDITKIEGRVDACEARVREHLAELAGQGLVWQSERGQRGYRWRWITDEDRRRDAAREANREKYRALAERIAGLVGDERERAIAAVGEYESVSYSATLEEDGPSGAIKVLLDYDTATAFAEWMESRVAPLDLPEVTDDEIRELARRAWAEGQDHLALCAARALDEARDARSRAQDRRRCAYQIMQNRRAAGAGNGDE